MTFHRRTFLRTIAVGACTRLVHGAVPSTSSADVGFSLYGMKDLALPDAVRTCAEIGYRNVELCLLPGYPTAPADISAGGRRALRELLAASRLTASGGMIEIRLTDTGAAAARHADVIKEAAQLAHDVQPSTPPVLETVLGGKPAEWGALKERMRDRLQTWAEFARGADIVIALKAHVGSAVNSPERLLWLLDAVASPHLCAAYDYSHFALQGLTLEASLGALLPRTKFIHVKDTALDAAAPRFLLPGEGTTDYAAYFRALNRAAWRGPVVVEVSSQIFRQPGYDPVAAARRSFAALAAAAKSAG